MVDNTVELNSWKEDIKYIFKIMPKIEKTVLKELESIITVDKNSVFKIKVEDKNRKYELTIKVK